MIHLGIDFGTTNTVVAYERDGKFTALNFGDKPYIPSLIAIVDGRYCYGHEALAHINNKQATIITSLKQHLHDYYTDKKIEIDDQRYDIRELLIGFFTSLKQQIQGNLIFNAGAEWDVIATVPANASSQQRWITLETMRQAGLNVRSLLNEPTASGFEFSHYFLKANPAGPLAAAPEAGCELDSTQHVLIYDFGGGTFDVSLLEIKGGNYTVLGSLGRNQLGGDTFDEKLFVMACKEAQVDRRRLTFQQRVDGIMESRTVKESISLSRGFLQRNLYLDFENIGLEGKIAKLKSNEYYETIKPDISSTVELIERLFSLPAIAGQNLTMKSVDYIYLVGGSSRLPYVIHAIGKIFDKARVKVADDTFATSAIGAAIYATRKDIALRERFTRNFGVIRLYGNREVFDPIFAKGTELPVVTAEVTRIVREYGPEFNIGHFKFFECSEITSDQAPAGDINLIQEIDFPYDPALTSTEQATVERRNLGNIRVSEEYHCDAYGIISAKITRLNDGFTMGYNISSN